MSGDPTMHLSERTLRSLISDAGLSDDGLPEGPELRARALVALQKSGLVPGHPQRPLVITKVDLPAQRLVLAAKRGWEAVPLDPTTGPHAISGAPRAWRLICILGLGLILFGFMLIFHRLSPLPEALHDALFDTPSPPPPPSPLTPPSALAPLRPPLWQLPSSTREPPTSPPTVPSTPPLPLPSPPLPPFLSPSARSPDPAPPTPADPVSLPGVPPSPCPSTPPMAPPSPFQSPPPRPVLTLEEHVTALNDRYYLGRPSTDLRVAGVSPKPSRIESWCNLERGPEPFWLRTCAERP